MSFSIPDEQAMKIMFSIATLISNIGHLYVNMNRMMLGINLNFEPFSQFEDQTQFINDDSKQFATPLYDDEEIIASNSYKGLQTETNNEIEE